MDWPSKIPDIRIKSGSSIERIEYEEMFGCLPIIGFQSQLATYEYPEGRYKNLANCSSKEYKSFTWRQSYDMLTDIAMSQDTISS